MRINDSLLDAVLQVSGSAGLFFIPRTDDKKHDPRYTLVNIKEGVR